MITNAAVVDNETGEIVNCIVVDENDLVNVSEGYSLVLEKTKGDIKFKGEESKYDFKTKEFSHKERDENNNFITVKRKSK